MNVLLVLAHPNPRSLTAALAETTEEAMTSAGHTAQSSDLYAMGWDPAVRLEDFGPGTEATAPLGDQAERAYRGQTLAADITREQAKLAAADLVVLHFPLWWHGMPAMLKGWFDRVFTPGFAYGLKDGHGRTRKYGDGGLSGRRALAVITAGDRSTAYGPRGIHGHDEELFFPFLHGIFWYTGLMPLRPHFVAGVEVPGWPGFAEEAARLRSRLAGIDTEGGIPYRTLAGGDYDADRRLRRDIRPGDSGLDLHVESRACSRPN